MDIPDWLKLIASLAFAGALWMIARREDRRQITRYLRLGGARVISMRKKRSNRWQTYYDVTFEELTGRVMRGVFSWQRKAGVMRAGEHVVESLDKRANS